MIALEVEIASPSQLPPLGQITGNLRVWPAGGPRCPKHHGHSESPSSNSTGDCGINLLFIFKETLKLNKEPSMSQEVLQIFN
jgi:hypothetical protein